MKIRLNNGVTYQNRANIFPPVKKNNKHKKKFFDENYIYNKIHEHFSSFDLIKLKEFGDDYENYGNITLKGISYATKKIKMDYIKKRAQKEVKNIFNFEDDDNIDSNLNKSKKKIDKDFLNKLNLPLLKMNKNRSMENIRANDLKYNNNLNQKNLLFNLENNQSNSIRLKDYDKSENRIKNNVENFSKIKIDKNGPILNKNISITNRNVKLFLQTNKLEVKTNINKKNHILKRNSFLRRYEQSAELNNKLSNLNNDIKKINILISKAVDKNDEYIPQFQLRFNHLLSQFKS